MKFKTSSIPKKSSGMFQLMSCDSQTIHVQTCTWCVCVCVCVCACVCVCRCVCVCVCH